VKQEAAGQTVATEDKAAHKATEVKGTIKEGVGRDVTIANGRSARARHRGPRPRGQFCCDPAHFDL